MMQNTCVSNDINGLNGHIILIMLNVAMKSTGAGGHSAGGSRTPTHPLIDHRHARPAPKNAARLYPSRPSPSLDWPFPFPCFCIFLGQIIPEIIPLLIMGRFWLLPAGGGLAFLCLFTGSYKFGYFCDFGCFVISETPYFYGGLGL